MPEKQDLKSLTRKELINWFQNKGIRGYRAKQVFNWIYKNNCDDFTGMKNLPEGLINRLKNIGYITGLQLRERKEARDKTVKYLWQLSDGTMIESVYLPYPEEGRYSVCISSQAGCSLACSFCATGQMGFRRDLTAGEIVDQVLKVGRNVVAERITNVVFMGMGEPLLNIKSVFKAIDIINDSRGINIGSRKITISTAGIIPGIKKMATRLPQVGLAVSLNAPTDKLRSKIMPINKKYPLAELIQAVRNYINVTGRRITFEYVLLKNINDHREHAHRLADLLEGLLCHVNLIPVNPVSELDVERPPERTFKFFRTALAEAGVNVTIRRERGSGIDAACGQLRQIGRQRGS